LFFVYSADHATGHVKVGPANGTPERYELQSLLSYLGTELHASVGPLFNSKLSEEVRTYALAKAHTKLDYVENHLVKDKKFLQGDAFTVADAYLYIIISWKDGLKLDLSHYPHITAYYEGIKGLHAVQEAHAKMATAPHTVV
jgi:glutathione S-transferase